MAGNSARLPRLVQPPRKPLPPSQLRTLQALANFWQVRHRAPTIMELANYLGVTRQPAYTALLALASKRYVKQHPITRKFKVVR